MLFDSVTNTKVTYQLGEHSGRTSTVDGDNPSFLGLTTWKQVELPEQSLFAPSLSLQITQGKGLLGSAELNLAPHIQKALRAEREQLDGIGQLENPLANTDVITTPVLSAPVGVGVGRHSVRRGPYTQLRQDADDEQVVSLPTQTIPISVLGRRRRNRWSWFESVHSAAAAVTDLRAHVNGNPTVTASDIRRCCDSPNSTIDGFDFKYAEEPPGEAELDPLWRVGGYRPLFSCRVQSPLELTTCNCAL